MKIIEGANEMGWANEGTPPNQKDPTKSMIEGNIIIAHQEE
jgi:hypothetical protein